MSSPKKEQGASNAAHALVAPPNSLPPPSTPTTSRKSNVPKTEAPSCRTWASNQDGPLGKRKRDYSIPEQSGDALKKRKKPQRKQPCTSRKEESSLSPFSHSDLTEGQPVPVAKDVLHNQSPKHGKGAGEHSNNHKRHTLSPCTHNTNKTKLTALPDDILTKIIHHALLMNPRRPGEISRRVSHRFRTTGRAIAMLSRRFHNLLRKSITSLELRSLAPHPWLRPMLVFAKDSLQGLSLMTEPVDPASDVCLTLARTAPPLRKLTITSLYCAPFEHVVAMLRALPNLREFEIQIPRPVDLAAIAHSCQSLESLSLGPVRHYREVDEIRRQIVSVLISPVGKRLKKLNLPWCCSTIEGFQEIERRCERLEHFFVEFGAMHWIRHRAYKSASELRVDLEAYANEQRHLFRHMLKAASAHQLQTFSLSTLDVIPSSDLDLIFTSLSGLKELNISFGGSAMNPPGCPDESFKLLMKSMGRSLTSIDVVGLRFTAQQVNHLAQLCPNLDSLHVWLGRDERPSTNVFKSFGKRIKHLSLLCDWNEPMCKAVGRYNTNLESLFLIAKQLSLTSVQALLQGKGSMLKEFSLFINRKGGPDDGHIWNLGNGGQETTASDRIETNDIVQGTARMVAADCAANLEKLNVSAASRNGRYFVDCTDLARELGRKAPHLWQICDSVLDN